LLDQLLGRLPRVADENVLIGFDTADDAGVYRLTPECALVQTVDFFTPIVDDPFTFGAIAAVNSLSDIYAMGGRPLTALSIVAFPARQEIAILQEILAGGAGKMAEAGCAIIGGHSVNDDEIKFGYAVTGTVHPARVLPNSGARAGDTLLLTKRLGTGVVATALKKGIAAAGHVRESVESMLELNRRACEAMLEFDVHACTDVTGFGLVGHAREVALASGVTIEIETAALRYLPGALEYARAQAVPGGLRNNRSFYACDLETAHGLAEEVLDLVHDPQTSGGLLISLPDAQAAALEARLPEAFRAGRVTRRQRTPLRLL
jgi:selenide,water dikinase